MTTRYQSLRSSISGNLPAAGTRLPGELWVNFPDLQLGLIDASKTAQRLVAVRYFSTTATYAAGDVVVQAGALYVANGAVPPGAFTAAQWTKVSTATDLAGYLPLAGGTMTGPIVSVTGNSINGAAGTARSLFGTTALSKRWELQLGGPSAEGGANAGSNFNLIAYNDAGAVLSTPMSIARATGAVTFGGSVTIPSLTLTALDNTPIGQTTPAAGSFTTLTTTSLTTTSLNGGPLAGQRNRVINGDMRVDQRNCAAGIAAAAGTSTYTVDRWSVTCSTTSGMSAGTFGPGPAGFTKALSIYSVTPHAPAAGDYNLLVQWIEGLNSGDLGWGAAGAQSVTLSFWFQSNHVGPFSGAIISYNSAANYPFSWAYPTANVWQLVVITIPGPTTGTWHTDNTQGLGVAFNLGCGSSLLGPAGAWASTQYYGVTGSFGIINTTNANFNITGVQFEPGSVATPFERRLYGAELALCQRYYQRYTGPANAVQLIAYQLTGNNALSLLPIPPMRAAPTASIIGTWTLTNTTAANITAGINNLVQLSAVATASGVIALQSPANGGFDLSAEL